MLHQEHPLLVPRCSKLSRKFLAEGPSLLDYEGGDVSGEDLKGGDVFGGGFKEVETFGEKKSRHTQGLVPGIRDAVHLEDVLKLKLPRIPVL